MIIIIIIILLFLTYLTKWLWFGAEVSSHSEVKIHYENPDFIFQSISSIFSTLISYGYIDMIFSYTYV